MTNSEIEILYDALDSNKVEKIVKTHNMLTGGYRTETLYKFGGYTMRHTEYTPKPKTIPMGQFTIYGPKDKFISHWNESFPKNTMFVYELCVAIQNKYNGRSYINPYKTDNIGALANTLYANSKYIFPNDMPAEKCADAIAELQQVLKRHILPYKTK